MPTSLAAMLALFNDNTSGDISAADGRAVIQALYEWSGRSTPGTDDAAWDGNDVADFTTILPSGSHTLTEQNGLLSVKYTAQNSADLAGLVRPLTGFAIGDSIQTGFRMFTRIVDFSVASIVLADGATQSSNIVCGFYTAATGDQQTLETHGGTWEAVGSGIQIIGGATPILPRIGGHSTLHLKLTYLAANSFRFEFSPDGISWTPLTMADTARTITPTHGGIGWTTWGGTHNPVNTYEYFKVNV